MTGPVEQLPEPGPAVPVSIARRQLAELVQRACQWGETTYLTRHGRPVAAIVPIPVLEALRAGL